MSARTTQEFEFRYHDVRVKVKISSPADDETYLLPEQMATVIAGIKAELKASRCLDIQRTEVE